MTQKIKIESFNPYETRFPNRKLVTKGTLELIKELRLNGYEIIVTPENDQPIEYLYKKGFHEFFDNPVYTFLIGIPTGIIVNILSNYIQKVIDKWNQTEDIKNNIIIVDNSIIINLNQQIISKSEIKDKKKKSEKVKEDFDKCFSLKSPYINLPTPIFINHKPKVIGWCRLKATYSTLEFDDAIILDNSVKRKIREGKIKGASLTGIATKSVCSICKSNYVECNHFAGDIYNNIKCINEIHEASIVEVSLVKEPINRECLINIRK
ncbi:hypothetical protein [Ferruginibacter albus]|uniref:hypothetical protein n=1 Tax=Ferruginibacter albus TaxID=2875540 RepID=UPI001CC71E2A|nr:hypothetical protein [Ferruginibacter albus]UAY51638.1 hypothetical protein K9M53_13710 [Ferruginibacter albus]